MTQASVYGSQSDFISHLKTRRLAELNKTRAKVAAMERTANVVAERELQHRKLGVLMQLSDRYSAVGPQLAEMSVYVGELKQYLQSVYDADLLGDATLQLLAVEHCMSYSVRLMELMADPVEYELSGSFCVMELASSALAMLASRPDAERALHESGAPPAAARALSPLFPSVVIVNVAEAAGHMAANLDARLSFRAHGGVGALVRLMRSDVEAAVQAAAMSALSMLAARDVVVQDSVRYLGGIDLLVDLLGSDDAYVSEAAQVCLGSLRHANARNASEVVAAVRASADLARDVRQMEGSAELAPAGSIAAFGAAASQVRSLIDNVDAHSSRPSSPVAHSTYTASIKHPAAAAHHVPAPGATATAAAATVSAPAAAAAAPGSAVTGSASGYLDSAAHLRTSAASLRAVAASKRYLSPFARLALGGSFASPRASLATVRSSAGDVVRTPLHEPGAPVGSVGSADSRSSAKTHAYGNARASRGGKAAVNDGVRQLDEVLDAAAVHDWRLSAGSLSASAPHIDVEDELFRKKHLARFAADETCLLLEEMGLDRTELRRFRIARVTGVRLLAMAWDDLVVEMALPASKAQKLLVLQSAVRLFDAVGTLPCQGRLTEVELRMWMALHGASPHTISKVLRLLRSLVRTGAYDFVTFWDFVTSYDWIAQAFRIYNLPC